MKKVKSLLSLVLIVIFFDSLRAQLYAEPNPFKDKSVITYSIAAIDTVSLYALDVTGKIVATSFSVVPYISGNYVDTLDLTGHPDGIYFLRLQSTSSNKTIKLIKSGEVGLAEQEETWKITAFPNPSEIGEDIQLLFATPTVGELTIVIKDITGRLVFKERRFIDLITHETIKIKSLNSGIYLLTVIAGIRSQDLKVIKY
jgi:hypothetical protein